MTLGYAGPQVLVLKGEMLPKGDAAVVVETIYHQEFKGLIQIGNK